MIKKHYYLLLALAYFLFFVKSYFLLDPDFGWHIKTGEYILNHGFPRTDPFSYTMPSFSVIAHEWSIDVLWAILYPVIGKTGLALIWSLIPTFFIFLLFKSKQRFVFIPLLLSIFISMSFGGIRVQVLSWVLFVIFSRLIFSKIWPRRYLLVIPLIFLIWANIHASFPIAVVILWIVIALRAIKNKRVKYFEISLGLLATIATFINPYGIGMWREAFVTFFDPTTRLFIIEWQPIFFLPLMPVFLYLALYFVFFIKYWKKFALEVRVIGALLTFMAISSARIVPLWLVFALPVVSQGIAYFFNQAKGYPQGIVRFKKVSKYAVIVISLVCLYHLRLVVNGTLLARESVFYPTAAAEYLVQNPPKGNLFASYTWGGYLIWKNPGKKVFMDGRMAAWRNDSAGSSESKSAVSDYKKIVSLKTDFDEYVEKFSIDTVLWPKQYLFQQPVDKLLKTILPQNNTDSEQIFINYLISSGWRKIYEDEVAVIYKKSIQ